MEVDMVDTGSVHSTEEKGKTPLYPAIDVTQEEARAQKIKEEEEARRLREVEAARKKAEEEERLRREEEERARKAEEEKRKAEEAEAAYQNFMSQVQPMIDELISTLEANPQYLGRLLSEYNATLARRGFGLILSGMYFAR